MVSAEDMKNALNFDIEKSNSQINDPSKLKDASIQKNANLNLI